MDIHIHLHATPEAPPTGDPRYGRMQEAEASDSAEFQRLADKDRELMLKFAQGLGLTPEEFDYLKRRGLTAY